MVYLFLDCDEYLATQRIRELKTAVGDAELADLNITEWEGGQAQAGEILGQAAMMPFLALRRLILLRGYLGHLEKRMGASKSNESAAHQEAAQFLDGLGEVNESCDLLLVENGLDKRRAIWKGFRMKLQEGEREVRGLQALVAAKVVQQEELATPDAKALPSWIQQRARARKIAIEPRAVQLLATYVGGNLRQLDNELEKLSLYAGPRAITADDVNAMVSDASEAMIWNLTDALSQRNPAKAMQSLQALRRGDNHPIYLVTMIARQYRIILKVKEALGGRGSGNEFDIAKLVGERPYPVKNAIPHAAKYSFAELVDVLDRLVVADNAMKTGADAETEIDLLVAELTQKPPRRASR
ncbi:MAG: DNA polymerase III subunit delta [Caldilineaceae bacterium]|nr:DNA polymerase III subunit delta [Caldilineaceae bacterium]